MPNSDLTNWLASYIREPGTPETISDHPWAQTMHVPSKEGDFFAKVLPSCQRHALQAMPLFSSIFPETTPPVVAISAEHGFLLLKDHGGQSIKRSESRYHDRPLIELYATMQAHATSHSELIHQLPSIQIKELSSRFVDYFKNDKLENNCVGASHFLGKKKASYFFQRIQRRIERIAPLLETASAIPHTINHCDLRIQNVAKRPDGNLVIFDWDDCLVGPAGLSLHNFFSGCSLPYAILNQRPHPASNPVENNSILDTYISTLVAQGYASEESIRRSLPGAICAGVLNYLLSYSKFPLEDQEDRDVIGKIIARRTDDLLLLCDLIACEDRQLFAKHLDDYTTVSDLDRSMQLMHCYVEQNPSDGEIRLRLANSLIEIGKNEKAEKVCRDGLAVTPHHPELRRLLGDLALEQLDLDTTIDQWNLCTASSRMHDDLSMILPLLQKLRQEVSLSSLPGMVPRITLSDLDFKNSKLLTAKTRIAGRIFREHGTLLVQNAFPTDLLTSLFDDFVQRYWPMLKDGNPTGSLQVGNRRFMTTIDIDGLFNDKRIYAQPFLMNLFGKLLEEDFVLGSFTAVASLPGAEDMRMHKDHPSLFPDDDKANSLPPFGITVLLPLLGLNEEMGTTRVVKGSHRYSSNRSAEMEYQDPLGPQGSCLLMDYRLTHQGLANRSTKVRPVLSMVYNRRWFRDKTNYKQQDPLRISAAEVERIPTEYRKLVDWLSVQ